MGMLSDMLDRPAYWYLGSKSDPRWNRSGRCRAGVFGSKPPEVEAAIERLQREYGEPPDDLKFGVHKE